MTDGRTGRIDESESLEVQDTALDEEALTAHAAERLAKYKVPAAWRAVDELPRTGTNKVKRRELVELFT